MGSQFAGRGDPEPPCPETAKSGRQDVERRIVIGVGLIPAGCALEDRLALAVLRCAVAALRAGLIPDFPDWHDDC